MSEALQDVFSTLAKYTATQYKRPPLPRDKQPHWNELGFEESDKPLVLRCTTCNEDVDKALIYYLLLPFGEKHKCEPQL